MGGRQAQAGRRETSTPQVRATAARNKERWLPQLLFPCCPPLSPLLGPRPALPTPPHLSVLQAGASVEHLGSSHSLQIADGPSLGVAARVAVCCKDHRQAGVRAPLQLDVLAAALRQQAFQQVAPQPHHQRLALRVAEAHVVLQQLGLQQHQEKEDGVTGRSRGATGTGDSVQSWQERMCVCVACCLPACLPEWMHGYTLPGWMQAAAAPPHPPLLDHQPSKDYAAEGGALGAHAVRRGVDQLVHCLHRQRGCKQKTPG